MLDVAIRPRQLYSPTETAAIAGISLRTLQLDWRNGGGPRVSPNGKLRFVLGADLITWLEVCGINHRVHS